MRPTFSICLYDYRWIQTLRLSKDEDDTEFCYYKPMEEHSAPWPKYGPASYFPSIEKKYGRSIAEWQRIIADCGLEKHMQIVSYLKSEYQMGHGHANALVGWTLAGNKAAK